MNNEELQAYLYQGFQEAQPLTRDSAMEIARERLKDYPKQLQQFSDWFEKHSDAVLERLNI